MKLLRRSKGQVIVVRPESRRNVRLVPTGSLPEPSEPTDGDQCLLIRDGDGSAHDSGVTTRRDALRQLETFAVRGAPAPLILLAPDGQPTGDRIG